jgi:hypothetical protein
VDLLKEDNAALAIINLYSYFLFLCSPYFYQNIVVIISISSNCIIKIQNRFDLTLQLFFSKQVPPFINKKITLDLRKIQTAKEN